MVAQLNNWHSEYGQYSAQQLLEVKEELTSLKEEMRSMKHEMAKLKAAKHQNGHLDVKASLVTKHESFAGAPSTIVSFLSYHDDWFANPQLVISSRIYYAKF